MQPIVSLARAGVSLGGNPVLRDVDLEVHPGQAIGISGPNGSGKTTLVRVIATLLPIDEGAGSVFGAALGGGELLAVRPRIGLIGHQPALIDELTLRENLIHISRLSGVDEDRISGALDVVGLSDAAERRASTCSFGMKRRVEVAHLLLRKPDLILLDEAASGLDDAARGLIEALVHGTTRRGGATVVVSHDSNHLGDLAGDVRELAGGTLRGAP